MFQATPQTQLRDYLKHHFLTSRNLRPDSVTEYTVQVNNLEKFWSVHLVEREVPPRPLLLEDLCDELLYGAMNWQIAQGREATTANKLRRHINAIWRAAKKIIGREPENRKYRENVSAPLALLPDELDRLLETAAQRDGFVGEVPAGQWWMTAILFVYSLGTRISAAYLVPTTNLNLDRGEVLVEAETQKQRADQWLDLFPGVVYWLRELRLKERGVQRVLGDYPYEIRTLREDYTKIFVEAGMFRSVKEVPRELKFHALRKTLASQLFVKGGMSLSKDRLGHSSETVTARYIDPRYKRQSRINDLVKDPSPARLPAQTLTLWRPEAEAAG